MPDSQNVERPHAAPTPSPAATPRRRASNSPPSDLDQQYQSLPYVSQFSNTAIQRRVINALHHSRRHPQQYNAYLLLIGGPCDPSAIRAYHPVPRSAPSRLHELATNHLTRVLDSYDGWSQAEHADNLVTAIEGYFAASLSSPTLKGKYIDIACKLLDPAATSADARSFALAWNGRMRYVVQEAIVAVVRDTVFAQLTAEDRLKFLGILDVAHPGSLVSLRLLLCETPERFSAPCFRRMPSSIDAPIVSVDFTSANPTGTNRLIDHLSDLAQGSIAPEFMMLNADHLDNDDTGDATDAPPTPSSDFEGQWAKGCLLGNLIDEVGRPDEFIRQGSAGTCSFTSALNQLAYIRPAEYARMAKSLVLQGSVTFDWNANQASQFYGETFQRRVPITRPDLKERYQSYRYGTTTMDLPPADPSTHQPGWNVQSQRSVTERVLQESLQRFINVRTNAAPGAYGAPPIDFAIFVTCLLGAQNRFGYFDDSGTTTRVGGGSCRVRALPSWLDDLANYLSNDDRVVFAGVLWNPVVEAFTAGTVVPAQCHDRDYEPYRWHHFDGHMLQLRSVRPDHGPAGNGELRVYFWNPWGARGVASAVASQGSSPLYTADFHDADGHRIDAAQSGGLPSGPTSRIERGNGRSDGNMSMSASEFYRCVQVLVYLDPPAGMKVLSLAGEP